MHVSIIGGTHGRVADGRSGIRHAVPDDRPLDFGTGHAKIIGPFIARDPHLNPHDG